MCSRIQGPTLSLYLSFSFSVEGRKRRRSGEGLETFPNEHAKATYLYSTVELQWKRKRFITVTHYLRLVEYCFDELCVTRVMYLFVCLFSLSSFKEMKKSQARRTKFSEGETVKEREKENFIISLPHVVIVIIFSSSSHRNIKIRRFGQTTTATASVVTIEGGRVPLRLKRRRRRAYAVVRFFLSNAYLFNRTLCCLFVCLFVYLYIYIYIFILVVVSLLFLHFESVSAYLSSLLRWPHVNTKIVNPLLSLRQHLSVETFAVGPLVMNIICR
eukprot:gene6981-4945_t